MFKFVPDTNVPGFRVGLPDDKDESAHPSSPAVPGGVAFGYDPYSNVLQAMVPTVFRPAGLFYQGNSGLFPMPYGAYVPVAGGSPSQDPLRQAVDRTANPYTNNRRNPLHTILPSDINGQDVGTFVGGALGAGLGTLIPIPGGPWLGAYVGGRLGRVLGAGTDFTADTMIDAAPLGANPVAPLATGANEVALAGVAVIAPVTRRQAGPSLVRGTSSIAVRVAFLRHGPSEPGPQQEAKRCQPIGRIRVSRNCQPCPMRNARTFGRRPLGRPADNGKPCWQSRLCQFQCSMSVTG